ncbi:MAG: helix-turn-helix domain-containing protein [Chloroflexi bacterium]|nr:helix-turn-helix domain-containing protein [Chloroflexota bacterium]
MTTARQKVLSHLKKNRSASAREIARALDMSAPNVRYHLGVLVSDGRAEVCAAAQRGGRGRPEKIYSLSQAALGDNLAALADALLAEAGLGLNLESLAGRILDFSPFIHLPISKRLPLLVDKLNEMHYQARWEAGAEGPRVILGRCPYAKLVEAHPELCRMEVFLLEKAIARPVLQSAKSETPGRGLCPFIFKVG